MTLEDAIREVKRRIAGLGANERISEADTKSSFINPILKALDWHIGNLAEVREEYPMPGGKRADYALLENGNPVIIVEAKAYGVSLGENDRVQYVNYAASKAIPFAVLTNGDEWEINLANEGRLEASNRIISQFRVSNSETADLIHKLSILRNDPSDRKNNIESCREQIWMPQVKSALIFVAEKKSSQLLRLLKTADDVDLPESDNVVKAIVKKLVCGQNHAVRTIAVEPLRSELAPATATADSQSTSEHVGGIGLVGNWTKLPNSLQEFVLFSRKRLIDSGFEEREFDFYSFRKNRECFVIYKTIRDPKVRLYPMRRAFDNWDGARSAFGRLIEPYTSGFFQTDYRLVIRSGEEELGRKFLEFFLANVRL